MIGKFLKKMFGLEAEDIQPFLDRNAIIVDVRTPQEFKGGHAKGAINIPLANIKSQVEKLKKKKKPIIVCCRSGARSSSAKNILEQANLEVVNGGSWQKVSSTLN